MEENKELTLAEPQTPDSITIETDDLTFHLEIFDGPLDLLLALIAKNKVSIYDIPIALTSAQTRK